MSFGRSIVVRADELEAADAEVSALLAVERPKTRGECVEALRPCPWVGCRYNLFLDVVESGNVKFNFPGKELEELEHTCALDVADAGDQRLEAVGVHMNLTRERVRQVEARALRKVIAAGVQFETPVDRGASPLGEVVGLSRREQVREGVRRRRAEARGEREPDQEDAEADDAPIQAFSMPKVDRTLWRCTCGVRVQSADRQGHAARCAAAGFVKDNRVIRVNRPSPIEQMQARRRQVRTALGARGDETHGSDNREDGHRGADGSDPWPRAGQSEPGGAAREDQA